MIQRCQFGNPNISNWKPPKNRPLAVSICDHLATPQYNEIGLRHFVIPQVLKLVEMRSEEDAALVCFWMPTRSTIIRMVTIAERVHRCAGLPLVLDICTGNGLLAFLLAQTGRVNAVGVDPNTNILSRSKFAHPNLWLVAGDAEWAVQKYRRYAALVIQSWPPKECDLTRHVREISANAILNIFDPDYYDEQVNGRFRPIKGYTEFGCWRGPSVMDLNLAFLGERYSFDGNKFVVHLKHWNEIAYLASPETRTEYPWVVEARERFGERVAL